jgi:hypothetical protein
MVLLVVWPNSAANDQPRHDDIGIARLLNDTMLFVPSGHSLAEPDPAP